MYTPDSAYIQIERLIHKFKALTLNQRRAMNEDATRQGYILPLFAALGWETSNINEVSPEEKVSRGFVDFSFRLGGIPRFFLETKRASEDLNDPRWVKQAIDYAWTKNVTWALLSDFEGLRVFNAEWKETNPFRAEFITFDLDKYLSDFERLWWLSREQAALGRLETEAEKVGKKTRRLPVSQHLFDDLKTWRTNLYKDLRGFNPLCSAAQVDEAVLRILNRLVFIRTAEDRQVEPRRLRALVRALKDQKRFDELWKELARLFREMDTVYNSELFARHFSEELYVTPVVLEEVIEGLYEKNFVSYNFNALDADVLGTVYEQYLGSMVLESKEEAKPGKAEQPFLLAQPALTVEERRQKRKSQGIYYTPAFITKYIVKQTLGRYLEENGYNPSRPPRILDMACGSGSFLIEAFDVLDGFVARQRNQAKGTQEGFHDYMRRVELLNNCIFGVDKDKQAVDVARLNLLLRALHWREKLPMLTNIYHADSLQPETWGYFKEAMQASGFDIIIGNPPYVRIQTLDKREVEYFNQTYEAATGNYDLYVLFVEKALHLLKSGGMLGFILPNKFMKVDYGIGLRKLLSADHVVDKIVDFRDFQVFAGSTTYTCLLFLRNRKNTKISVLSVNQKEEFRNMQIFNVPEISVPSDSFTERTWTLASSSSKSLFEKLDIDQFIPLLKLPAKISRGSSSGADSVFIVKKVGENLYRTKMGQIVELEKDVIRIPLYATDFGRYHYHPKEDERIIFPYTITKTGYSLITEAIVEADFPKAYAYLLSQRSKLEERKDWKTWYAFSAPRNLHIHDMAHFLVPLLANKGLFSKFESNQDYCLMASGGFSISIAASGMSSNYLLGLLNSKILFWYLRQISNVFRGGWITCTKQYVGKLPIRQIDFANSAERAAYDEIVHKVEEMLALHEQLAQAERELDDARHTLAVKIRQLDEEIDALVYQLYGFTEEEIAVVEG